MIVGLQLDLPLVDIAPNKPAPIHPARRVYVSRNLKMSRIDWVGFDMDYTLAIYNQEQMDRLSIEATVTKLIERGYPQWLADLHYPLDFPIRGVLIDKRLGNVLKMNRFKIARRGYHGLRELGTVELRALYYEKKLRHKSSRYHWIDTLYGLSEACTYAAAIEAFEQHGVAVDYRKLFDDIRECIDEAHRDGTILRPVMADKDRYLQRDPLLAKTLHKLRSAGKKLFLLTNSRWEYTRNLMSYLLDDVLPDYSSFQQYFDVLVVAAKKPRFFQERDTLMELRDGELSPAKLPLERGRVYQGGNLHDFQAALGVTGNRVLYVGDHIYGDMLRSKKDSAWRTAMVIQELEAEVRATEEIRHEHAHFDALYGQRAELEDQLRLQQQLLKAAVKRANGQSLQPAEVTRLKRTVSGIRRHLRAVDDETSALRRIIARRYHHYWGSLLKQGAELSLFGDQVSEYACVYTSRVSNLLHYSPHQYFRSPRGLMHHEL
jgi:HAD superfamily 5'-nucleotidase-like hydrolase